MFFNPSVSINGVLHSSYAGGVTFNPSYGISLSTTPQSVPPGGTAFVINYNFTPGNKYDISITAVGNPALLLKTSVIPNFNQFLTNSTTSCTPDNYAYSYGTAGYGQFSTATATNSTTYSVPQFTMTGNNIYPYLIVWVSGGRSNLSLDALSISQISITQTPVASFTISSSITSMTCGATNPVTFTINNNGGTTGITGYTWNIGTTPNGWLYNGSPAPATISTTGNTLQLTPDCGKALSSVSATVAVGSNNYNTSNSAGISIIQPSYSISGNSVICSGSAVYSIFPTPSCNSSVSWQSSNTNIATVTSSGNSATVTKVGVGSVTLTATISNACGNTLPPVTKSIQLGDQGISSINLSWLSSCYGNSQSVQLDAIPSSAGTNWKWTVGSGNFAFTSNSTGSPSIQGYVTSWAIINLSYNGSNCQNQFTTSVTAYTNCSYRLAVSPNPATNSINLSIGSEVKDLQQNYMKLTLDTTGITKKITKPDLNSDTKGITNIYLYDFFTNRLVKKWAYRENSSATYNLNMADVKRGVYVLRVERDNISSTIKVILN